MHLIRTVEFYKSFGILIVWHWEILLFISQREKNHMEWDRQRQTKNHHNSYSQLNIYIFSMFSRIQPIDRDSNSYPSLVFFSRFLLFCFAHFVCLGFDREIYCIEHCKYILFNHSITYEREKISVHVDFSFFFSQINERRRFVQCAVCMFRFLVFWLFSHIRTYFI